jgi:hypothetical protein
MDSRGGRVSDGRTRGQTAATDTTTIAIATSAVPPNAQASFCPRVAPPARAWPDTASPVRASDDPLAIIFSILCARLFREAQGDRASLPIMLPEYGVDGGGNSGLTELQQAMLLQRMIAEFDAVNPVALVYHQPFDMSYQGQPQWYKDLWSGIGLGRADGTSKYSYFIWRDLFRLGQ